MSLPIRTSVEDVEDIVSYLKTKVKGATVKEAKAALGKGALDGRKVSAYEAWGFVNNEEGRLALSEQGRRYAKASDEEKKEIYRRVIRNIRAYRAAAEWMFHQNHEQATNAEVGSHWYKYYPDEIETEKEKTMRAQAVCFFRLSEAAGLGKYVVGRGSKSTRLEIRREPLERFVNGKAATEEQEHQDSEVVEPSADGVAESSEGDVDAEDVAAQPFDGKALSEEDQEETKVFISHGKNMAIVSQVKETMDVLDIDFEVAVEEETGAIPVSEKVLNAMRKSNAAVICVTADEQKGEDTSYTINKNVLIEIGAAFVLYDQKVVLVWDERLPVPSNLQGLYLCKFEGEKLSSGDQIQLMKTVKKFKA
ncbi:MAG: hypothetical protein BRD48_01250 [Bacteroidetes bacterium QS_9_68_14]|nr:MAG: hypothetical protein BRD48_01250 [Bacteroidetes bacterium QS_9_68_14]